MQNLCCILLQLGDDDERSSGDFQGPGVGQVEEDVIRALGPSNVQKLASMHAADLEDFEDDESEEDEPYAESSEPDSEVEEGVACTNCTFRLDLMDSICPVRKRPSADEFMVSAILEFTPETPIREDSLHK